jgi:hypothetical protein
MDQAYSARKILHGDPLHGGLRAAVLVIMALATLLAFPILLGVVRRLPEGGIGDFALVLSCTSAVIIGVGAAGLGEYLLRRTWRSGRSLLLDEAHIEAREPAQDPVRIDLGRRFLLTTWQFAMTNFPRAGRERQIRNGWLCLACQLQQESNRIVVYTFVGPQQARTLLEGRNFHELHLGQLFPRRAFSERFIAPARPVIPSNMLADARHGAYWLAEQHRWLDGVELAPADFELFLDTVDRHHSP